MESLAENCLPITGSDLSGVDDLDKPLTTVDRVRWFDVMSAYNAAAKEAKEKGAEKAANAYRSVAILCSFHTHFDNAYEPYTAAVIMNGRRSLVPGDLSNADLDSVAALRLKTKEPLLRARVGDILWVRRHDHIAAKEASADYIVAAKALLNKGNQILAVDLFRRALQLGHWLGRENDAWHDAEAATLGALKNLPVTGERSLAVHFLDILVQMNAGDAAELAAIARQYAEKALGDKQPSRARDYRLHEAALWHRAKDETNERVARLEAAKTYEIEAERWIEGEKPSYFAASGALTKGIEALRQAHGDPAHIEELRQRLMRYQRESMKEMKTFEQRIDISDAVRQAVERVTVPDFREALKLLAFSMPLVDPDTLRKTVLAEASEYVWQSIVDTSLIDESGRITKNIEPLEREQSKHEAGIESRMFRHASEIDWQIRVSAFIEPARRQIWSQHLPSEQEFDFLVVDNPFVPPGHEGIFRRGLYHGLQGDLLLSGHLLTPQIENSIRYILEQRGVDVSNLQSDLTQPVKVLGPLLDLPETKKLFGDAVLFELRGILIEKTGYSFRNRVAHGFVSERECYAPEGLNLWWLVLRLCYTPLILGQQANEEPQVRNADTR
ncbi:MAG TPA: DUF4209 domain-containing protein [Chthoniobacterales bacterium]|nr:DUF4209 domain-containing protein [Chthoniobacterales bacterium]